MNIQFSLTPSEGKRLVAKGVVEMLKPRLDQGSQVYLARGTTSCYVLDEVCKHLGVSTGWPFQDFVIGQVVPGKKAMWFNPPATRAPEVVISKDKGIEKLENRDAVLEKLRSMKNGDVAIKGGNAIDPDGRVGVLVGNQEWGGTIGTMYPIIKARGIELMIPIGLEKMINSDVTWGSIVGGALKCKRSRGLPCGLFPVDGTVITEITALELLFDVEAIQLAAGGVGGAEGSIILLAEADDEEELDRCWEFLEKEIFGEPPFQPNPGA